MGLGSYQILSLAEARNKAIEYKKILATGNDPVDVRDKLLHQQKNHQSHQKIFSDCAKEYINTHSSSWKNKKHHQQWVSTLENYAFPVIGNMNVALIDTDLIMKILRPIWPTKTETASRLRGRIESILDWSKVKQYRTGENPARWKGHLDQLLPAKSKVHKVENHPALPYKELPLFMSKLKQKIGFSAPALEFSIFTACRSGEVREATWDEIDLIEKIWIIPASRMKASKEHRIPLTDHVIDFLNLLPRVVGCNYVFPSIRKGKLSDMSLTSLLKRMDYKDITQHGFRSTFRDWAGETTEHAREVIEHALAHRLKDRAEAAYQRGDYLNKRRALMEDWTTYCLS